MQKSLILRRALLIMLLASLFLVNAIADDFSTVKARLYSEFLKDSYNGAGSYLSSLTSAGKWNDINYADHSVRPFTPINHVYRLHRMAVAYQKSGNSYYHSAAMKAGILRAIDYWYSVNPRSDNWWFNDVGVPTHLGPIAILMEKELGSSRKAKLINDLDAYPKRTGQNKVWSSRNVIIRGLLEKSVSRVQSGVNGITSTIVITPNEGVQSDYTFHQHGPQLFNGGYGAYFINDTSYYAYLTRGTSFAFSKSKIDILEHYLLDSNLWMSWGVFMDISARGREFPHQSHDWSKQKFLTPCNRLAAIDPSKASKLKAMANYLNSGSKNILIGDKHFWRSDYHVHREANYSTTLRMASPRTVKTEIGGNGGNKQGYYLSVGAHYIYITGNEYKDIYPVWDWGLIPGVTSLHKDPAPAPLGGTKNRGKTEFVGGASDGKYGVVGYDFEIENVTGKKAWFYFDDAYIALGTGINSTYQYKPVYTSINQCLRVGTASVSYNSGSGSTISSGTHTLKNPKWVYHDNVGYIFNSPTSVVVKIQNQSGTGKEIDPIYLSSTVITKNVFSLYFDHGVKPTSASYQYIVTPGKTKTSVISYANNIPIVVKANNSSVQAVYNNSVKVGEIVFYKAGSVTIRSGLVVRADKPCIVVVNESQSKTYVTVSEPTQKLTVINVTLDYNNQSDKTLRFNLPTGLYAGKSVTLEAGSGSVVPNKTPTASASATTATVGEAPLVVTLNGSASSDSDGSIVSYSWNFGDGGSASGVSQTHIYKTVGVYTATLTVKDNDGATATDTIIITVKSANQDSGDISGISVIASSDDGHIAENTLGNNLSTRWSALGDGEWIQYDLGKEKTITGINIAWYRGNLRKSMFDIEVSVDGSNFTQIYSGSSSGTNLKLEKYSLPTTIARYVRIVGYGNSDNPWNSITEVKIATSGSGDMNGMSVIASSDDGHIAENTLGNNLSTRWSALGDGEWIQYDLGKEKTITGINIAWYRGNLRKSMFDIEVSVDGSNFTQIYSGSSSGTNLKLEKYSLPTTIARYVRIVGYGNSDNPWNSITEVKIITDNSIVLSTPTLNWKLDETSGTIAADSVSSYNGTLNNGARWSSDAVIGTGAVLFDGVDDAITLNDSSDLHFGANDFTVSFWIKKLVTSTNWKNIWGVNMWNSGASHGENEWSLGLGNKFDDQPSFSIESNSDIYTVTTHNNLTIGKWHYLVGVRSGDKIMLYVDGQLVGMTTIGNVAINNAGRQLMVANSALNKYQTKGLFDDIRIYKQALSSSEIVLLYQKGSK